MPPGEDALWHHPPFGGVVEDGRIWGRGSLDMKGALVAAVFALKAVREVVPELAGTVHLTSVVGEEDGGLGTLATLLRGYRADGAIVLEPTDVPAAEVSAPSSGLGLLIPVQGVNREQMPDPRKLAALIAELKEQQVGAIFPEKESNPKILQALTRDTGIKLGEALIADGTTAESYEAMVRHNVTAIVAGLAK